MRLSKGEKRLKTFACGLVLGLSFGIGISAWAAKLVGGDNYLIGWDVLVDGETVCSDPYIWTSTHEIECD